MVKRMHTHMCDRHAGYKFINTKDHMNILRLKYIIGNINITYHSMLASHVHVGFKANANT